MDKFFVKEFFDKSTDIIILIIYLIKLKKEKIIRIKGVDNFGAASCSIRIACDVRPYTPIGGAAQSSSRFFSDKVIVKNLYNIYVKIILTKSIQFIRTFIIFA